MRDKKGRFLKGHKFVGGEKGWFKKGGNAPFKGKKHTSRSKKQMSELMKGKVEEKSRSWKGDKVKYDGLQLFIRRRLGKAKKCSNSCKYPRKTALGKIVRYPSRFYWVNKSRVYKRELSDWIQLCPMCAAEYNGKTKKRHG